MQRKHNRGQAAHNRHTQRQEQIRVDKDKSVDAHAAVVRKVIQGALRGEPPRAPRDLAKLLDLLYELCLDANERVDDEAARAFLSGIRTGGKTGKLRDRLLALR
jgi:hypothetical protein